MGKFLGNFMEKIGFAPAEDDEEQDDNETYSKPKTRENEERVSSYSSSYSRRNASGIRLSTEVEEEPEEPAYRSRRREEPKVEPESKVNAAPVQGMGKVMNLQASVQMEVVVSNPESFEEAIAITDDLKNNKPVVINLEYIDHATAQRITDFLCGACYALGGKIEQIADKIYMIAPGNVDIAASADFRKTLQNVGGLVLPLFQE